MPFGILLKTYRDDGKLVERLVTSFNRFNLEKILMALVVPKEDRVYFDKYQSNTIKLFNEEDILSGGGFIDTLHSMSPGYLNQQIIKISFWETNLFENYLCIDSDFIFIRNFKKSDFIDHNSVPYLFCSEDLDLISDPYYYEKFWLPRQFHVNAIRHTIGFSSDNKISVHGMIVMSSNVLEDLKKNFMNEKGLTYKDLISIAPLEFSWYLTWLLKIQYRCIHRNPIIKVFHTKSMHFYSIFHGVKLTDLARAYIGIVINSNYAVKYGISGYKNSLIKFLFWDFKYIIQKLRRKTLKYLQD